MTASSPHLYVKQGQREGYDLTSLENASRQIRITEARNSTPVLSLNHLSFMTGARYSYLRNIVSRKSDPYGELSKPKYGGGFRTIAAPSNRLMQVQRWILHFSLSSIQSHPESFAYQKGRSILDCARRHSEANWLIKIDLHDFFETITEDRVYRVFQDQGYSNLVSFELARLTTRIPTHRKYPMIPSRHTSITDYDSECMGRLPQGAPTSGALANAVATPLDFALNLYALDQGLVYTRYSDDMAFSSHGDFSRNHASKIIREASSLIRSQGFVVHRKKTRVVPPGARHVILGLNVSGSEPRLLPEYRRRIESHVRGCQKFGLLHHVRHRGFRSVFSFINYLDGCIAFAKGIESKWSEEIEAEWERVLYNYSALQTK